MKQPILYNSEAQEILKKYHEKRMEYAIKGIKKQPHEIMEDIKNEKI